MKNEGHSPGLSMGAAAMRQNIYHHVCFYRACHRQVRSGHVILKQRTPVSGWSRGQQTLRMG
jgi:hypothetical protein